MTTQDLLRAWPDAAATHDVSDTEIARIAAAARDLADAERIWRNEDWWLDTAQTAAAG